MTATILRADARSLPLAENTVDLVVTSPPYFGLRSYQDGGEHYAGQIGDEPTPAEFVEALLEVTRECVRVLKPSGSLFVNLGDKYAGAPSGPRTGMPDGHTRQYEAAEFQERKRRAVPVPTKSLIGVPWRYALACIDDLGLILRAEVIWSKPNGLPESVTDRVRRSHETWFHFSLQPRYFSAVDEVREEHLHPAAVAYNLRNGGPTTGSKQNRDRNDAGVSNLGGNPLGKLPGSVWTVPTQPLTVPAHLGVDHFAAFPMEWPRRIVRGWSPSGICVECGEGRRPVADRTPMQWRPGPAADGYNAPGTSRVSVSGTMLSPATTVITGEACACPTPDAPTRPAVVLDPFGGTGTTALVASALGRHGISVDRSADYCRLAAWRTTDPGQRATAMQVDKPPQQLDGQADLFDLLGGDAA